MSKLDYPNKKLANLFLRIFKSEFLNVGYSETIMDIMFNYSDTNGRTIVGKSFVYNPETNESKESVQEVIQEKLKNFQLLKSNNNNLDLHTEEIDKIEAKE